LRRAAQSRGRSTPALPTPPSQPEDDPIVNTSTIKRGSSLPAPVAARYRFPRTMSRYESLRASDADRDAVTDRLRRAAGEGRLEPDELEERVDAALRARTYRELGLLVADLPPDGDAAWVRPPSRGPALARVAVVGVGVAAAVTAAVVVIAVVVLLVLAVASLAAITWVACALFWLLLCRSRRRGALAAGWRRDVTRRHVRHPRATGFL
jgi:hypothetical protein